MGMSRAAALLIAVVVAGLVPVGLTPTQALVDLAGSDDEHRRGLARLHVTPDVGFVGGQRQTYEGHIGIPGRRAIWLEANLNRPGDRWNRLPGTETTTSRDGSFSIDRPAPSMFDIRYRVKGRGGFKSPDILLDPSTQELLPWAAQSAPSTWADAIHPAVGQPFVIAVDTTPRQIHRTDVKHLPVFEGRLLTLQRQTGPTSWETVASTTVGPRGMGYFENLVENELGPVVYRVRQERVYAEGNKVGWQASFPLALTVGVVPLEFRWWEKTEVDAFNVRGFKAARTASSAYGWGRKHFDFDWDQGHDLDSPPTRGRRLEGGWTASTQGSGRASAQNGQLVLFSSVSGRASTGDFGTTRVGQTGKPRKFARWEIRMRWQVLESGVPDYRIRLELVPPDQMDLACPDRSITIGTWQPRDATYEFGMSNQGRHWSATATFPDLTYDAPALAVEADRGHTTWFVDGQPVGSVKGRSNQLATRLVLRLSLEGGPGEYASTKVFSDWQRGFGMNLGREVLSPAPVPETSIPLCQPPIDQPTDLSPVQN